MTEFWSLSNLLNRSEDRKDVGALATAIEVDGIWGWDRYLRFTQFKAGSPEALAALDALAEQAAYEVRDEQGAAAAMSPSESGAGSTPWVYGWPDDRLPNFATLDVGRTDVASPPRRSRRSEEAMSRIIGALVAYILGEGGVEAHPAAVANGKANQGKLISQLCEKFDRKEDGGMSKSNLEKKFAAAKELLKQ
jgi:hypothetical protein